MFCRVPPKAPPPGISSLEVPPPPRSTVAEGHPGRVPPKAPGIPSLATEERLAALEEEMIRLRLRVAELEQHSSGAATG